MAPNGCSWVRRRRRGVGDVAQALSPHVVAHPSKRHTIISGIHPNPPAPLLVEHSKPSVPALTHTFRAPLVNAGSVVGSPNPSHDPSVTVDFNANVVQDNRTNTRLPTASNDD
jgi:hypothetical protein